MDTDGILRRLLQRLADERLVAEGRAQGWAAALAACQSAAAEIIQEEESASEKAGDRDASAGDPQPE